MGPDSAEESGGEASDDGKTESNDLDYYSVRLVK